MENSNKRIKKSIVIFIILIVVLALILVGFLVFYTRRFTGGLSSDHSIWAEFGDYFNGVISPIFAAINIGIFWYLTIVIEDKNDRRQVEIQANEDRRRKQDADHQKAMILMQFRKDEVDRLNEVLQVSEGNMQNANYFLLLTHWGLTVDNFLKSKLVFFGLKENSKIAKNLHELNNELTDIIKEYPNWLMYCNSFDSFRKRPDAEKYIAEQKSTFSIAKECYKKMSDHFKIAMDLKTSIINDLQKITLGEKIS